MTSSFLQSLELFDFDHQEVEKKVSDRDGSYQGLAPEALYTPIEDLKRIFTHPLVQGTLLDLGCGNARTCLFYASMFPNREAIGIEFEEPRLGPARDYLDKYHLSNVKLIHGDLLLSEIPHADSYFLYLPTGTVLDRILSELYSARKPFRLIAIESHGDLLDRLRLENWLTPLASVPLASTRHAPDALIFERNFNVRDPKLLPFELSFLEKFLLIKTGDEIWIAETLGMEWVRDDRFELKTPPRTIFWKEIIKICELSDIDNIYREAIRIRRMGKIQIQSNRGSYQGFIRKIVIKPTFHLELSDGTKVEWDEVLTIHQESNLCYDSSLAY